MKTIYIGHPSYDSWTDNHFVAVHGYAAALRELLSRRVSMRDAHAALQSLGSRGYCSGTRNKHNPIELRLA